MIAKCKKFLQKKKKVFCKFEDFFFQILAVLELRGCVFKTSRPLGIIPKGSVGLQVRAGGAGIHWVLSAL